MKRCSSVFSAISIIFVVCSVGSSDWQKELIMPQSGCKIDGVNLGDGRNDGVIRLYGSITHAGKGLEWSWRDGTWSTDTTFSANGSHCTPRLGALKNDGNNAVYVGSWSNNGVKMIAYNNGWITPETIVNSKDKGNIYALKIGDGCNDTKQRLYIGSDKGLYQYTWNGQTYDETVVLNSNVGEFDIGNGRNDGINRIYAGQRNGKQLHELTWNGTQFSDTIIYTHTSTSKWATHVAAVKGDGVRRIYAWCGTLIELEYRNKQWVTTDVDLRNAERYYIRSGSVQNDKKNRLYVSEKGKGLMEYTWNGAQNKYEVDAITAATGGCAMGDGRGDGKVRLYVAGGTRGHFQDASVVELTDDSTVGSIPAGVNKNKINKNITVTPSGAIHLGTDLMHSPFTFSIYRLNGTPVYRTTFDTYHGDKSFVILHDFNASTGVYVFAIHYAQSVSKCYSVKIYCK